MRKRTGARYVPITISLLPAMVNDVEGELQRKQSRSMWIADAIRKKLDGDGWNLRDDGNAKQWLAAFKMAMDKFNVKIDAMFWQIIEQNVEQSHNQLMNVESEDASDTYA